MRARAQEISQLKERLQTAEGLVKKLAGEARGVRAAQPSGSGDIASEGGKELQGKVTLKVGSQKFSTSAETLKIFPESWFGLLASGRVAHKVESDGSIFVDASSKAFPHVLEYLRCGGKGFTIKNVSAALRDELLRQADFFMLPGLERILRGIHVCTSHNMAIEDNGTLLQGKEHSAATLDVPDPDHFQVTCSFKNGKAYSGCRSLLIGVAPIDAALETLDCNWESRPDGPAQVQRITTAPTIADAGLFVCVGAELLELLYRSRQSDVEPQTYRIDSRSRMESVKVCFERTGEMCKIAFRVTYWAAQPHKWLKLNSTPSVRSWDVTTADFGLAAQSDYRPMLFFEKPGWVKIDKA